MDFNELMLEYAMEGTSNFVAWKDCMEVVLDDNGLLEYIKTDVAKPQGSNAQNFPQWKKDVAKARRITLEGVRDHILSNLHGKETPFATWKEMKELFENNSDHMNLALKDKILSIKIQKNDTIPQYLSRFTLCRDELGGVYVIVPEEDLVALALFGLPNS